MVNLIGKIRSILNQYFYAKERTLGSSWNNKIIITDDFDQPCTDIETMFYSNHSDFHHLKEQHKK